MEVVDVQTSTAALLKTQVQRYCEDLQGQISASLEKVDGKGTFFEDGWSHEGGGGGKTRVLQNGNVFEKAGVNFSAVSGKLSDSLLSKLNVQERGFFATGISLVLHPLSPMIPAVHMNLRYIELVNGDAWFGGGTDLTPYYLFDEDVKHFHSTLKNICNRHNQEFYPRFKKWCDEYFFIKHRGEGRGVGGVFFDYIRDEPEKFFRFVKELGQGFLQAYLPIVERRRTQSYTQREREWQLIRRGRYVEFNLLYDRGTLFGLETHGRTESILMSLPPTVKWVYDHQPEQHSPEEKLLSILQHPREWV
jgi:coproporphyrinogen III oxidase